MNIQIYIKPSCPYCIRLLKLLDEASILYETIDVIADPRAYMMMQKLSGQKGVPEVRIGDIIIPDYGTEETLVTDIQTILAAGSVTPNVRSQLTSVVVEVGRSV